MKDIVYYEGLDIVKPNHLEASNYDEYQIAWLKHQQLLKNRKQAFYADLQTEANVSDGFHELVLQYILNDLYITDLSEIKKVYFDTLTLIQNIKADCD